MNQTVSQAFDSRAMPLLLEPSTAPSAFSLWQWLGNRMTNTAARRDTDAPRDRQPRDVAPERREPNHGR